MLIQLAWRNIWRNKRRSLITLAAMTFGLFSGLVTFAVGDGAHLQMTRVATSTYIGHIQINRKGFHQHQKIDHVISVKEAPVRLLKEALQGKGKYRWQKKIKAWSPRVFGAGLVSTGKQSSGGFLLGLDLLKENRVTHLSRMVFEGVAKAAYRTGQYRDRLPPDFLKKLKKRLADYRKIEAKEKNSRKLAEMKKLHYNRAFHLEIKELAKNPKRFEPYLKHLLKAHEVVIGKGLALALNAKIGDPMAVITQGIDGSVGNDRYTIVGIIETGDAEMDLSICIMPIAQLQELLVLDGFYHTLVLSLTTDRSSTIRKVAAQIDATLKKLNPHPKPEEAFEVLPWQKVSPELYEFIKSDEASQYIMVLVVFFLVAFIILNTFQMSIMERTREFGVLKSIGMKGRTIIFLLLWEALFLALVATVVGMIMGIPVMLYLQNVGIPLSQPLQMGGIVIDLQMEAKITLQGLLFSPMVVLITTLLVSFFPAYRISRMKPVDAIHHL